MEPREPEVTARPFREDCQYFMRIIQSLALCHPSGVRICFVADSRGSRPYRGSRLRVSLTLACSAVAGHPGLPYTAPAGALNSAHLRFAKFRFIVLFEINYNL